MVRTITVISKLKFCKLSFRISHLATKPVRGGIPAKLAISSRSCHFFVKFIFVSFIFLKFVLFKYIIIGTTVLQYKKI